MSSDLKKILFSGIDNAGKTSILLLLTQRFSLLSSIKPTFKAKILSQTLSFLGLKIATWDLGGQSQFREEYLQNKNRYFSELESVFFVIDIQESERFEESLEYLKKIIEGTIEYNPEYSRFIILFHKCDPDVKKNEEILENISKLEERIKNINQNLEFSFHNTTIYDENTLLKAFSDGVILVSHKARMIQTLLKEYTSKSFNSAAILLDRNCFIIASRSTKEEYEIICQEVAPRLTRAMETLEEYNTINAKDIVTNIEFPQENSEDNKDAFIFLRKLDINNERLYIIALCLNKKVKQRSYEYIPLLAENLKSLLKSFD